MRYVPYITNCIIFDGSTKDNGLLESNCTLTVRNLSIRRLYKIINYGIWYCRSVSEHKIFHPILRTYRKTMIIL